MEKPAQHIVCDNLVIMLVAAVVLGLVGKFFSSAAIILFGMLYIGQVAVNFLLGVSHLFNKASETRAAPYFLSMLLVLIIGFGACSGMMTFTDSKL